MIGWIIGGALLAVLGFAFYTYNEAFFSPKRRRIANHELPSGEQYDKVADYMHSLIDELEATPYERVEIKSFDGLKLVGRYYHVADGAPLHIQFHGYRGAAVRDLCGGCKVTREIGHNMLVVDQRAHGESEGLTICFGVKERRDVQSWVDYPVERFGDDVKIVLSGVSMGGATVLEASRLELKPNVKCVIADSPFSSPEDIIRRVCSDTVFPPSFAMPFVKLGALVYGRLRLGGGAIEAVKESRLPILIIHGEADYYVPAEMGKKVYEACTSKKRLLLVPDAGHGISFIVDGELYVSTVKEFLNEVL